MNKIIALVGMPGTGKSVVSDFFEVQGYASIYFGGVTMDVMRDKGMEPNEENEKAVREELRKKHGMAAYAIMNLPKIDSALEQGNVIVDGLYSWSEYKVLKERFGAELIVLAIASPRMARYGRLANRKVRPLTEEQAQSRDYAEIENLEKGGPIAIADYTIVNDGTIKDLVDKLEKQFGVADGGEE